MRWSGSCAIGTPAVHAAKAASLKPDPPIPVIFSMGSDPGAGGFVDSFNHPGGNTTGVTSIAGALAPKRLELMREFLRDNAAIAILINPRNPLSEARAAGRGGRCPRRRPAAGGADGQQSSGD